MNFGASSSSFESVAVVPAAGRSARMGRPKLTLPWNDATIIQTVLGAWRASRVERIVVVVHPDDDDLAALCTGDRTTVVRPAVPPPDMKASVLCALQAAYSERSPAAGDVWLLAPADLPTLAPAVIDALLAAHDPRQPAILAPVHQGRRGHPVLFPAAALAEVERLGPNEGVNRLLQRLPLREIAAGREALPADVDTPADYRRLRAEG